MTVLMTASAQASYEIGDRGDEVVAIQKQLAALNYEIGTIDGVYGQATADAVTEFQKSKGLAPDGIVGDATYRFLMNKEMPVDRSGNSNLTRTLLRTAHGLQGVPYYFGGSSPRGFDCSGFVQYVFRAAGIVLPRAADSQYYSSSRISLSQLRAGDLVFFTTYDYGASHVGIYIGNSQFIHASSSRGVMVSSLHDSYWGPRYYGAGRVY